MIISRKKFLQAAGLSLAAIGSKELADLFAGELVAPGDAEPSVSLRWAMAVDLAKCFGQGDCDKCIQACHKSHNVPEIPAQAHDVRWVWKASFDHVFPSQQNEYVLQQFKDNPFLTLCNHCDEPPCVRVCPTQATWKREDGIVMMDWHRCIGCRYCMAACPYGSRSFNWADPRPHIRAINADFPTRTKGVVEKCTFCEDRLSNGHLPACVDVCPSKALVFGNLADAESPVRQLLRTRYSIRRKPELGTRPEVYYLV
jgi:molybdopterin-containing oxidoreductase family iron-sulfur binding subunit